MIVKNIVDEDFVNYKKPSMFIGCHTCSFKCGADACQNRKLIESPDIQIDDLSLVKRFCDNPLTKAIVFGGLEPLDDAYSIEIFLIYLRFWEKFKGLSVSDIVIYTGYTEAEAWQKCPDFMKYLTKDPSCIMKFGRYEPGDTEHMDTVLGVYLSSHNQYAKVLSA